MFQNHVLARVFLYQVQMLVKIQLHLQQDQVIVSLNLLQHLHHHQSQPMIQTDLIIPVRGDLYEMFFVNLTNIFEQELEQSSLPQMMTHLQPGDKD